MKSTNNFVTIILLNWNGWEDTLSCLNSLYKLKNLNFDIFVVDNGSTDNSVAKIRMTYPEVEIFEMNQNLGFAKGNN